MPPTMKDVAELAGVSVKTVSRFVNREPYIRPEVARRVLAAIDELGWVANSAARALRTGRQGRVGIAVAELRRPALAILVEALVQEVERRGLMATVEPTHRDPQRVARVLAARGHHFDGLIMIGPCDEQLYPSDALGKHPVVMVQGGHGTVTMDRVDEDVAEAAALSARHLAVMGRRRPVLLGADRALVGPYETSGPSAVLRAALSAAGIDAAAIPQIALTGGDDREAGASAAARALEQHPELDSVLCTNDEVALGALTTLVAAGVLVPDDVAVIGYDALEHGQFSTPSLTTIDPGASHLARAALELLGDRMAGSAPERPQVLTTPVALLRRESTMGRR